MAYNRKSMARCIADNDFMSAVENLKHTSKRWANDWFDCCMTIMENDPRWKAQFEPDPDYYEFHPITIKTQTALRQIWFFNGKEIFTNGEFSLLDEAEQKCYLFRFCDIEGNLIFAKIGTTTKPILNRIKSELREYEKWNAVSCIIDRVYDCGTMPAEGLESYFRWEYIRRHPEAFRKNDRFFNVAFDLNEADEIMRKGLAPV